MAAEPKVLALEIEGLTCPALPENLQLLVQDLRARLAVDAIQLEVWNLVGDPDTKQRPAPRQVLEHQQILGQADRMVEGGGRDGGSRADSPCALGQGCTDQGR